MKTRDYVLFITTLLLMIFSCRREADPEEEALLPNAFALNVTVEGVAGIDTPKDTDVKIISDLEGAFTFKYKILEGSGYLKYRSTKLKEDVERTFEGKTLKLEFIGHRAGTAKVELTIISPEGFRLTKILTYRVIATSTITFEKGSPKPRNIEVHDDTHVIAELLSEFRRCLVKKTGEGKVTIAYLDGEDSRKYKDGTPADLTGSQGDVMVNFPEFYYKWEPGNDDHHFCYRIARGPINREYKHVSRSLLGAYKAYEEDHKLYSRSGVTPTTNTNLSEAYYETASKRRGLGYQIIDFQQHCVIALMLYAKYKTRDLQTKLGFGNIAISQTGISNENGNRDTTATNPNKNQYASGLGIECVFGGTLEWVQGVVIENYVWTINDPDGDKPRRIIGTDKAGYNGHIIHIKSIAAEEGPYFDMVPTDVAEFDIFSTNNVSENNTYYSNDCYIERGGPYHMLRGGQFKIILFHYGVSFAMATEYSRNTPHFESGSRLAFRGHIEEEPNTTIFKNTRALP